MVAIVLLPLRGQWTKFTKILLSERTFFFIFSYCFLSSPPSLHTCTYMCLHVCTCECMCKHVCICTCAYVCVPLCAEYCKMGRNIFLPCPTSPPNAGSIVLNLQKACFPCFWGMLWGSGKARLVGNSSLWGRQADHMIKTSCDTSKCFSTRNPGAQEPGEASSNYGHGILFISFISSVSEINHSVWLE